MFSKKEIFWKGYKKYFNKTFLPKFTYSFLPPRLIHNLIYFQQCTDLPSLFEIDWVNFLNIYVVMAPEAKFLIIGLGREY